ncbi:hypothetical protein BD770DRAFT_405537 [Pilaira anomala]|nr:hypothetical protein BD770DRAFT_405537 [Pilaira anomala]
MRLLSTDVDQILLRLIPLLASSFLRNDSVSPQSTSCKKWCNLEGNLKGNLLDDDCQDKNHQSNSPFDIRMVLRAITPRIKLHEPLVNEYGEEGDTQLRQNSL